MNDSACVAYYGIDQPQWLARSAVDMRERIRSIAILIFAPSHPEKEASSVFPVSALFPHFFRDIQPEELCIAQESWQKRGKRPRIVPFRYIEKRPREGKRRCLLSSMFSRSRAKVAELFLPSPLWLTVWEWPSNVWRRPRSQFGKGEIDFARHRVVFCIFPHFPRHVISHATHKKLIKRGSKWGEKGDFGSTSGEKS